MFSENLCFIWFKTNIYNNFLLIGELKFIMNKSLKLNMYTFSGQAISENNFEVPILCFIFNILFNGSTVIKMYISNTRVSQFNF